MGMLCGVIWKAEWHPMMVITPYALGWGTYGWVDARAIASFIVEDTYT